VVRGGEGEVRFGYMPQQRAMELHWPMTGFDVAAMAVSARRPWGWIGRRVGREPGCIRNAMRELGVEHLERKPFAKLSGGQQQRILLAGAVAAEPNVLVLDEPTEGLDVSSRKTLLEMLKKQTARGIGTVIISHEVEDLMMACDEIAWVHVGEQEGEASSVEMIGPEELGQRMARARGVA
jgi:ABC-type Mn2+/Zn2+ transport system ATPase subunit